MSRLDVFKSWLREGIDDARGRLEGVGPFGLIERIKKDLANQGGVIPERALTSAVAHLPGVEAASATARHGAIHIQASFEGIEPLDMHLTPFSIRFATRGAKELVFRVQPPEASKHPKARAVVGSIAACVAHGLWGMVVGKPEGDLSGAIVDRDGPETFRIDLRTVPTIRTAAKRQAAALVLDALELGAIIPEDGEVRLRLRLPSMVR